MNRKHTKRALFSSVLALVLCFSMMLGTTFAWFTDSVTSTNNIIKAGNLDVELEYSKDMSDGSWKTVKGSSEVINKEALWEPGHTEVVYLKLSNLGTLALKYSFKINFEDTVIGKTEDDKDIKLSEHLKYAVVDVTTKYADRDAARKAVESVAKPLAGYAVNGEMQAGDKAKTVALVIYMPESVGNEANYRGTDVPQIVMGIDLFATQLTAEYDSFGNDYDAMAGGNYHVQYSFSDPADLLAFAPTEGDAASSGLSINADGEAQIDKAGAWHTIDADLSAHEYVVEYDIDITDLAVGQNVTVDTGEQTAWGSTPIMLERGSTKVYYGLSKNEEIGTLEGTKVHVTHVYSYNNDNMLEITTTVSDGVATLTYTKAVTSAAKTSLYWDIYFATEAGKATMDDFSVKTADVVVDSGAELAEVIAKGGNVVLLNDVTAPEIIEISKDTNIDLNGKNLTANLAVAAGVNVVITGGEIASASPDNSAIETVGDLTLDNVTVTSDRHGVRVEGGTTVINGGTYTAAGYAGRTQHALNVSDGGVVIVNGGTFVGPKGTASDSGSAVNVQAGSTVTINGGSFSGGKNNTLSAKGTLIVKGGTFDQDPSAYLASGFEAVANADGTYTVTFPQESFDSLIENAQPGDTVELPAGTYTFPASDLKEGVTLECAEGTVFEGTSKLNVNGATVVGATFSNPSGTAADQTINGTFKDCVFEGQNGLRWCYAGETVVFENCVFSGSVYGVHFDGGANEVIFKNCTFSGFNALGGAITKVTMEGCTFKANGKSSYNGINLWGSTEMTNCTFVFDGTASYEWVDLCGENKTATFTNCVVTDGTTEKGMETVVGNYGLGNNITINGETVFIASDDSDVDVLADAVTRGATKILLTDGEYDLKGNQKDGLTLIGMGSNVKMANTTQYAGGKAVGAIWQAVNLENVTITNTVYTMADGGKSTFTNVTFAAGFRNGYGSGVVFNNCTFGSNSEGYALHFQSDASSEGGLITLTGCEFEGGKVHLGSKRAYAFTGCDFAAGTDFQVWSNITLENCTVDGEKVTADNVATFFPNLNLEKVTLK